MRRSFARSEDRAVLQTEGVQALIECLARHGYRVLGPAIHDGAIVYREVNSTSDLPVGWTDDQKRGAYRLNRRRDDSLFGYAVGPHSWKQFLHPSLLTIFRARRTDGAFRIVTDREDIPKYAFLGVRPCEASAIEIQDTVFLEGQFVNAAYNARRKGAFIVAVNCGFPAGTCFCSSMGTGPEANSGFDIALTEVLDGKKHYFLLETGTPAGAKIAAELPTTPATAEQIAAGRAVIKQAEARMGRSFNTDGLKEALQENYEHPGWDTAVEKCLTCGNCTSVCPTCFCTTVEDFTDISGDQAERRQRWDSCFTQDFSYIFGGSVRPSPASRYRQWLLHKLANWQDQFGTSGCVGCGRCITWCPTGIDIREEAMAIVSGVPERKEQTGGNA